MNDSNPNKRIWAVRHLESTRQKSNWLGIFPKPKYSFNFSASLVKFLINLEAERLRRSPQLLKFFKGEQVLISLLGVVSDKPEDFSKYHPFCNKSAFALITDCELGGQLVGSMTVAVMEALVGGERALNEPLS